MDIYKLAAGAGDLVGLDAARAQVANDGGLPGVRGAFERDDLHRDSVR